MRTRKIVFISLEYICLKNRDLVLITLSTHVFCSWSIKVDKIIKRKGKKRFLYVRVSVGGVCVYTYLTYTLKRH